MYGQRSFRLHYCQRRNANIRSDFLNAMLIVSHEYDAPHSSVSDSHDFDYGDFDTVLMSVSSRSQRSQRRRYDHESTRRFSDPTISDRFRT